MEEALIRTGLALSVLGKERTHDAAELINVRISSCERRGPRVTFEEYDQPGMKTVNSIVTAGGAKAAWFKDHEGNILAIIQEVRR